ncbi:hypothetical protein Dimus_006621 [Dionaea muscipula]
MAELAKLRLVRCPKCENLLPELPDYSVYQCGGCGAVLRANKGDLEGEKAAERSCEERVRVASETPEDFMGKEAASGVENGGNDGDPSGGVITANRYAEGSKGIVVAADDNLKKHEMGNGILEPRGDEVKTHSNNEDGSRSASRVFRRRMRDDNGEDEVIGRNRRGDVEGEEAGLGFLTSNYAGEGTSKCHWNCNLEKDTTLKNETGRSGGPNREEGVDREAIMRKLDELKDQLSQTCNEGHDMKMKEKNSFDRTTLLDPHPESYAPSDEWFHGRSFGIRGKSREFCPQNKQHSYNRPPQPQYCDHYNESLPVVDRYGEVIAHSYQPLMQINSNYISRSKEDSLGSHKMRPPPSSQQITTTTRHQYQPSHPYSSGHHIISPRKDPYEAVAHSVGPILNQFSCSCHQCHGKHQQVSRQMPSSSALDNITRLPQSHIGHNPIPCHHQVPGIFGPQLHNSRICSANSMSSYNLEAHSTIWPRDLDQEFGSFAHSRPPRRVVLADGGRQRHCHPVAGGSPFITCHNCFELLKLPKKVLPSGKNQWRACCGGCSSMISLSVLDGKLVVVGPPKNQTLKEVLNNSNEVVYEKPYQYCSATMKLLDSSSFRSEDYDISGSGYDFQSADKELDLNCGKSEESPNVCSLSPSTSEDGDCQHDLNLNLNPNTGDHDVTNAVEIPVKVTLSSTTSGSPMENFDDSSKYRVVNRCGKGSISGRSDQERPPPPPNKCILRQNSLKESMATEMDNISVNDFPHAAGVTQDAMDVIIEDVQPRGRRGIDAFLAGLIKKSFRDLRSSQPTENAKRHVTVNGRVVPDRLIKKAEKLAGPIYPGQYWYDYRAGFWGEMGGPCLGILPPFIEEFNYPMPENCASGDTGVFVNGRELHQKDLDLLATRGLPVTRDRSYIIDISGRVLDEDSGEVLDSLGRLAPTIEKVKHGFGMRVPKAAA